MKKLITTHNGGMPFHLDSLRWMEQGISESLSAICKSLALERPAIKLFGAGVTVEDLPLDQRKYTIEQGAIFQDNEIFLVPAHTVECPAAHQAYWDTEELFDPSGYLAFRDGLAHNVFSEKIMKLKHAASAPDGKQLYNAVPAVAELLKGFNGISRAELTIYIFAPQKPEILPMGVTYDFVTGALNGNLQGWSAEMPADATDNADLWASKAVVISDNPFAHQVSVEWGEPVRVYYRRIEAVWQQSIYDLKAALKAVGIVDDTEVNALVNAKIPEVDNLLQGIEAQVLSLNNALAQANTKISTLEAFKDQVDNAQVITKIPAIENQVVNLETNIAVNQNFRDNIKAAILSDREFFRAALIDEPTP